MGVRWRMALWAIASLLLIASCGGGGSGSTTTSRSSISTVSLPLQSSGLAVGGDVQSRATYVFKRGITKEQAQLIADKCGQAAEIANVPQDCLQAVEAAARSPHSCDEPGLLCFGIFDVSQMSELGYSRYIEINDDRSETSLCDAAPDHACLRVGVARSTSLDQVVAATVPTSTSSEVTTSTEATTETTPTSISDTSSSTPGDTSAPTESS